jgi:hypothetical protein
VRYLRVSWVWIDRRTNGINAYLDKNEKGADRVRVLMAKYRKSLRLAKKMKKELDKKRKSDPSRHG